MAYDDSNKVIVLVFEYNKTSLPLIFKDVVEEAESLGSDDNSQFSNGESVNLKHERKQSNEPYLDNKENMLIENLVHNEGTSNPVNDWSTTSGDVDHCAFSSDIQDDKDDNGDQSTIHIGNIIESIVSTDDDVSLCSLTVCIFGINRFIILNPNIP